MRKRSQRAQIWLTKSGYDAGVRWQEHRPDAVLRKPI